jgi:hypothetical protein
MGSFSSVTSCSEQSPSWQANSHSSRQEIHRLLWNQKVHYRLHKSPPLVTILSQMSTIHTFPPDFPKIRYNIILSPEFRSSELYLTFRFCIQYFVCISYLSHACCMSRLSQPPSLDNPNNTSALLLQCIIKGSLYTKLEISQTSCVACRVSFVYVILTELRP